MLLECTTQPPKTIRPLPLAKIERDGDDWETYGFPDANELDGLTVGGTVRNSQGNWRGHQAYQLLCDEAGAGQGLRVHGLSGAPVIIDKAVVGVIRSGLLVDERDEGGTLYACPASLIADRYPDLFREVKAVSSDPRAITASRKWVAVVAVLALTLAAAYVSDRAQRIRPPSAPDSPAPVPPKPEEKTVTSGPPDRHNVAAPRGRGQGRQAVSDPAGPTAGSKPPGEASSSAPAPDPQLEIAKARLMRQLNGLQVRKDAIVPSLDALRQRQSARGLTLHPHIASAEARMIRSLSAADDEIGRSNINLNTVSLSLRDAENAIKTLEDFLNLG